MRTQPRVAAGVVVGAVGLLMTACVAAPASTSAPAPATSPASAATVEVEKRDITDAIGIEGAVSAGATYDLTAPISGTLHYTEESVPTITALDGSSATIALPGSAMTVETLVPEGAETAVNTPVVRVVDSALLITADVSPAQLLRLGERTPIASRAQIEGSSGPFECALIDRRASAVEGTFRIACRIPDDVPAVVGAPAQVVLVMEQKESVAALPIEAVAGTIDHGSVYPVGSDSPVEIKLGVTDGVYVEIVAGLSVGERVEVPSPSILP